MKFSILDMISKQQRITLRAGGIVALALFLAVLIHPAFAQYGTAEQISCTAYGGNYYLDVDCNAGGLPPGFMSPCWICEPAGTSWCTDAGGTPVWSPIDAQMAGGYWDCIMPQTCSGSSACAANTCSGSNCTDTCGNSYAGTKTCTPPVYTCQDYGYNYGTVGCCYNNADRSDDACYTPPVVDVCPSTPGNQSSTAQCNCTDNPSGSGCGPTYSEPAYVPIYTQSTYAPTYSESTYAPTYSQATYAPSYSESTYAPSYSQGTYAPVGCGTPAANLTAAPTRVRSGQTSTLTLSATGVTTSCTITGPGINTTVAAPACVVNTTLATPPITSQVTYKVTCDGSTDIAKIIVNLAPRVNEF